jgi:lysophospholipase L1-like esterase
MKSIATLAIVGCCYLLPCVVSAQAISEKADADAPRIADEKTYLKELSERMNVDWPANHTIHIVCHGHSVPSGYFKTPEVNTMNAYPHLWHEQLAAKHRHAVINVIVTAIGGEQSDQGAARFERDVLSHRPELVTIDYSLNDRGIGLENAKKAWSSMIEKAQAAGIKVLLLTPTPDQSANLNDPQDALNQHAVQVRELAAKYHVGLVDSTKAFQEEVAKGTKLEDLMSQVNHPNRAGHELVTKELMKWFP